MPIRPIIEYPDPRLRLRADPVTEFDANLAQLIDDLLETLKATKGIALSAPQTGDRRRVVVIDLAGGATAPAPYVNPEILARAAPGFVEESCLSVPGVVGSVWRATKVTVRASDRSGETFERELEGMHAVCMQHEIDHLEGKLFIDRLWLVRRLVVRSRLDARARRRKASGTTGVPGIA
jgi:peptide deformylase